MAQEFYNRILFVEHKDKPGILEPQTEVTVFHYPVAVHKTRFLRVFLFFSLSQKKSLHSHQQPHKALVHPAHILHSADKN